jgi:hypothetical protein
VQSIYLITTLTKTMDHQQPTSPAGSDCSTKTWVFGYDMEEQFQKVSIDIKKLKNKLALTTADLRLTKAELSTTQSELVSTRSQLQQNLPQVSISDLIRTIQRSFKYLGPYNSDGQYVTAATMALVNTGHRVERDMTQDADTMIHGKIQTDNVESQAQMSDIVILVLIDEQISHRHVWNLRQNVQARSFNSTTGLLIQYSSTNNSVTTQIVV